jgi:hypothetical protein
MLDDPRHRIFGPLTALRSTEQGQAGVFVPVKMGDDG